MIGPLRSAATFDFHTVNNLVRCEGRRRAALVGAVEDRAVDELALVVALARRRRLRVIFAVAVAQHFVHEAALERDDAIFFSFRLEPGLALRARAGVRGG